MKDEEATTPCSKDAKEKGEKRETHKEEGKVAHWLNLKRPRVERVGWIGVEGDGSEGGGWIGVD